MDQVRKAIQDKKDGVAKKISPSGGKASGKSRTGQEGEVRTWKSGDFRKQGGKWVPVSGGKKGKTPPPSANVKPKKKEGQPSGKKGEEKQPPGNHHVAKLSVVKDLIKTGKKKAALEIINNLDDDAKNLIPHDVLAGLYKWEAIYGGAAEKGKETKAANKEAKVKEVEKEQQTIQETEDKWAEIESKYDGMTLDISQSDKRKTITLGRIIVPSSGRNQGMGTSAMEDVIAEADRIGYKVILTPSADFGGNVAKLKKFYKRFGFVENKGGNRDFSHREDMYRESQSEDEGGQAKEKEQAKEAKEKLKSNKTKK